MTALSKEEEGVIIELSRSISRKLSEEGIKLFRSEPTAYVAIGDERLHIAFTDEGNGQIKVNVSSAKQDQKFGFFINRFMLKDFLSDDASFVEAFAESKVLDFLEETREINAYSRNLQRARSLIDGGHHYAAEVMLVSAFEVACRDIFFRYSQNWFMVLTSPHEELYVRFGKLLTPQDTRSQVSVSWGDKQYGFDREAYDKLKAWESILVGETIIGLCRQLGIVDEYLQSLYGNSFKEIGHYEILLHVLQNSRRRPLDFQMLEGTGGTKWSFKHFYNVDLDKLPIEMKTLKDCFQERHRIIHGELDDKAVTKESILQLEASVRKVISFLRDEMMTWEWVLD